MRAVSEACGACGVKVWIVERCIPYEGCDVEGVFSSRELAQAFIDGSYEYVRFDLKITEWIVDGDA